MPVLQTDLLAGLSESDSTQLAALGEKITTPAGHILFNLGEPADRIYLVLRGRIALTLPMQIRGGEQDILVEERLAGETLGWSGLIPPHRFTLKASASVESDLLTFSRSALLEYFESHPGVGYTVSRNVASVIGHRLEVFQTMWSREMQRVIELRYS